MASMNRNWQQTEELSNNFWVYLLYTCTRILGRNLVVTLLVPGISFFYTVFAKKPGKSSKNYLRRVLEREPGFWDVYKHFYTFAVTSIDRIYILSGNFKAINFTIDDEEKFNKTVEYPGAVLITTHLGSYDIMRVVGARVLEMPIHILLDKYHNAKALSLLQGLDPVLAGRVIDAGSSGTQIILEMQSVISAGGKVGIMADRLANADRVFRVKFLGEWVRLPMGPWIFAYLLNVPVILCFGLLDGDNKYRLYVEDVLTSHEKSRASRELIIEQWIQSYVKRLEHYVRIAPYNWFNFYEYWEEDEST